MDKLLLISIIMMSVIIPAILGRIRNPRSALFMTVLGFAGFSFVYVLAVMYIYPRLLLM